MNSGTANKGILVGIAWLGTLALAWFIGASGTTPAPTHATRTVGGPISVKLVSDPGQPADTNSEPGGTTRGSRPSKEPRKRAAARSDDTEVVTFSLEGVETIDDVSARLMKYAAAKLAGGPESHLELFRTLDQVTQNDALEKFVNDERDIAHLIYPWVQFLVERDKQIVSMMETIYRTGAENPARFEGIDDDTFEIFTEGVAFLIPGVVSPEQLERLRAYAQKIVETPEDQLPDGLGGNQNELRRNLKWWMGPLAPDVLRGRILDSNLPAAERLRLIADADRKVLEGMDLVGFLSDQLSAGNPRVIGALGRVTLSESDVAVLDQAAIAGVIGERLSARRLRSYLRSTRRRRWPASRAFIEDGLRQGGNATNTFATLILFEHSPRNDKAFVQHVLATYTIKDSIAADLKRAAGIQ
ncbi:MAG: hypothetical protein V3T86_11270 [Planctomycetota bacterium]